MECHYHPGRKSSDKCAICGKNICKECGLELGGKTYCKDCLGKITGLDLNEKSAEQDKKLSTEEEDQDSYKTLVKQEPARLEKKEEESPYDVGETITNEPSYDIVNNEKEENFNLEEANYYKMPDEAKIEEKPLTDLDYYETEDTIPNLKKEEDYEEDEFIYPDHSYQPGPTSASQALEEKYAKYLDDLYYDDEEPSLSEELAKDEEKYGSLTKAPYVPKEDPIANYYEEDSVIVPLQREEGILAGRKKKSSPNVEDEIRRKIRENQNPIHSIHYKKKEKEPIGIIDILLKILLVILILLVIYYVLYLFLLSNSYPTFTDALFGLAQPGTVLNNLINK